MEPTIAIIAEQIAAPVYEPFCCAIIAPAIGVPYSGNIVDKYIRMFEFEILSGLTVKAARATTKKLIAIRIPISFIFSVILAMHLPSIERESLSYDISLLINYYYTYAGSIYEALNKSVFNRRFKQQKWDTHRNISTTTESK